MQTPPFSLMEHSDYASPLGMIQIGVIEHALAWIGLPSDNNIPISSPHKIRDSLTLRQIKTAFDHYFNDANYHFDLPLFLQGTPFQKKVWQALQTLEPGEILSYSDLALRLKTHPRAIGNACRTNRIPIVIPCHRIVSKAGLGGYADAQSGQSPSMKIWLLQHEKATIPNHP